MLDGGRVPEVGSVRKMSLWKRSQIATAQSRTVVAHSAGGKTYPGSARCSRAAWRQKKRQAKRPNLVKGGAVVFHSGEDWEGKETDQDGLVGVWG